MNRQLSLQLTVLLALSGVWCGVNPSRATAFDQQEVDQKDFIAIARPYGSGKYDLLILQQFPGKRLCWNVNGADPGRVQPLLLEFDFTGSCERATDSNGYSIRLDGHDGGLDYLLRIIERGGELWLVASPRDPRRPELTVGRTKGRGEGLLQIYLLEGWRFTKRVFEGQTLSHIYLTGDGAAIASASKRLPPANQDGSRPVTDPRPATGAVREYTFTASGRGTDRRPPAADPPRGPISPLPPPPPSTTERVSRIVPPPPPSTTEGVSRIVPPPPPRNARNRGTLSDVIAFNRRPPASDPPPTASTDAKGNRFKVMVEAKTDGERSRVRTLYPDAFRTSYRGKAFWQIGVFSGRDKAESVLQGLAPLSGSIVPF